MTAALLSTTYFGPVQWYQKLNRCDRVLIEACESYQKQSYRNRCVIATTNGLQALTVPVEGSSKDCIRDIRISDHNNWRHLHWNALLSAYSESPFFDYYADDVRPFFERRWQFLFDFNLEIIHTMCTLLDVRPTVSLTTAYEKSPARLADLRTVISPKHPAADPDFEPKPYYQVFALRHGFQPNLSILDLLFNMGPEGIFCL